MKNSLTIASFNVSMEATNYVGHVVSKLSPQILINQLANNSQQIKNIAQIIQTVAPDIIFLNEFDYISDPKHGIECFIKRYLNHQQGTAEAIDYPYYYYAPVNSGQPSPYDLTGDGIASGAGGDAWGFGFFPGHYAMVLLSRYPIEFKKIRTFKNFKWCDMPNAKRPRIPAIEPVSGEFFYNDEIWQQIPLSSKSHWDISVKINGKDIHILASHPTPPVFDGTEQRNACRNHDEVRFWLDYISGEAAHYIYDDYGRRGGLKPNERFVIVGDLNASVTDGNSHPQAITALLTHPKINDDTIAQSQGSSANQPHNPAAKYHTARWAMRADYVLPSRTGIEVLTNGIFWPQKASAAYYLIKNRRSSSDHRLVWSQLNLINS
jgi:endonuclease/exonuclease/phosphatase family metal-dependent hydrolase